MSAPCENASALLERINGRAILLAATKTVDAETINSVYQAGIRVIGENRVNELVEKYPFLDKRFDIHFIGTLQRNKVKYIIDKVSLIHSLSNLALAEEIEKQAAKINKIQDCLVEINVGKEESKDGVYPEEAESFIDLISRFRHIRVRGLMCIPPKCAEHQKKLVNFQKITKIFIDIRAKKVDNNNIDILSMGMSGDYEEAIECGSTMVRIGEGIFGKRIAQPKEIKNNK